MRGGYWVTIEAMASAADNTRSGRAAAFYPLLLAWRELRGGLNGFRIFLACITLGVFVIVAVLSLEDSLTNGLRANGQQILGGDVSLRITNEQPGEEELHWLGGHGRVDPSAELRSMIVGVTGDSTLAEIKAVGEHYPLYGDITLHKNNVLADSLDWRDGHWGVVVDPVVLDRLALSIGDILRLGSIEFIVRDVILLEPDRASGGGFALGPRVMISIAALSETGLVRAGSQVVWNYRIALPADVDVAQFRGELAEKFPTARWRLRDLTNPAPQLTRFVAQLAEFLSLVGMTALMVGGIGVANAISAWLARRAHMIAVMKCLGADGRVIMGAWLIQVMVVAILGSLIGALAGLLLSLSLLPWATAALQVSVPVTFALHPPMLGVGLGLLTALFFSLWPLARARGISPAALMREAIEPVRVRPPLYVIVVTVLVTLSLVGLITVGAKNHALVVLFLSSSAVMFLILWMASRLLQWLVKIAPGTGHTLLRLALANLCRPGNVTTAVMVSLGMGLSVLVTVAEIEDNLERLVIHAIPHVVPSFFLIDIQPDQREAVREAVNSVTGLPHVTEMPHLRGRIQAVNDKDPTAALVNYQEGWVIRSDLGITYADDQPLGTQITTGAWWPVDYRGPPLVSISSNIARAFNIGPGESITFNILGRSIAAKVASVRDIRWSSLSINFSVVFSPGVLEQAPQTWLATVAVPSEAESATQRALVTRLPNITVVRVRESLETVHEMLAKILVVIDMTAGVALVSGLLVLSGTVVNGQRQRERDAVLFKVLGATRQDMLAIFMTSYGILAFATAVTALLLGTATAYVIVIWVMNQEWELSLGHPTIAVLVGAVFTLIAGFIGTWRALGRSVADHLRQL